MDDHTTPTDPPGDLAGDATDVAPSRADSDLADMVRSIHAIGEDVTAGESGTVHE